MSRLPRLALAAALVFALAACDATTPPPDGPDDPGASPDPPVAVEAGAPYPEGRGDAQALLYRSLDTAVSFGDAPGVTADTEVYLAAATLFLTGTQDGQARYAGGSGPLPFTLAPCEDRGIADDGFYAFFRLASGVEYTLGEWPVDLGAPLTEAGAPRVYGDLMAWESYCTGVQTTNGAAPAGDVLTDLRINHAAFRYERADLAGARFLRFEITNTGDAPVTDLRTALFADADVGGLSTGQDYRRNLMGSTDRYAYVYASDAARAPVRGAAVATALLEAPGAETVRRVVYRDRGPAPDALQLSSAALFQETRPTLFHALLGLDDEGQPIVDPTTNAPSTMMYDGDPVAGTGWLDGTLPNGAEGWDVRTLQATDPVTLAPGETVVLTAVAVAAVGADRADGLATVDAAVRDVAADPGLWRFPVAGR